VPKSDAVIGVKAIRTTAIKVKQDCNKTEDSNASKVAFNVSPMLRYAAVYLRAWTSLKF